jgi:exodeoxyribonuclease VII small subunit
MNFEEKVEKSKTILEQLMDPEITLQKSVELYKEGMNELSQAQKLLEEAKIEFLEYQKRDQRKNES